VFAEEVGGFCIIESDGPIKWCLAILTFRINIRAFGNQQFDDLLVTLTSRPKQGSPIEADSFFLNMWVKKPPANGFL